MRQSRAELADAGTMVPSLRLDPAGSTHGTRCPLLEPGGCRVDFAARLMAALHTQRAAGV
ncbi:hypothetical protein GCM10022206_08970 [Streptomyces chiangmaiensis]